jgi:hypothetical protein
LWQEAAGGEPLIEREQAVGELDGAVCEGGAAVVFELAGNLEQAGK